MFLKLLPMQIFAVGILSINGILNSLIVGNMLGTDYLAVFGYMIPVNCIHSMLGGGIATGSQILCGRFIGCGDKKKIGDTYATVSVMCIVIGALLTLLYQFFSEPIASLLGASGDALKYTSEYIRINGLSIIFMLFSSAMIPFLQLNNASGVMYISVVVLTASNFGLDILGIKIFGKSMVGIGIADTLSYILADLVILIYYFSKKCPIHFSLRDFSWKHLKDIFLLGLPNATRPLCLSIRNVVFNNVAVSQNVMSATALAIQSNMGAIADAVGGGIDGSTSMSASIFYGERDKESLRETAALALKIDGLMQISVYIILYIIAEPFARLFGTDDATIGFVTHALRFIMLYLVTNFCMNAIINVYKGIGKTVLVNIISVFCYLLIPVSTCLLLPKNEMADNVWISFLFPEIICFIALVIYSTIKRHRFPGKLTEIAYIPESFGISSSDRYDAVVKDFTDVSEISQNAIEFCKSKNLDSKKSYYCGLCIEELAMAILNHGKELKKNSSGREIDLRMIYENDGISILLRDNYPKFDPMEWSNIHEPEDPMRYIGIRMVTKLAQEVNYTTALTLNVLTIRI